MDKESVRRAVRSMVEDMIPLNSTWCTVKSVSGDTCTVTIDELDIENIVIGFDKSGVIIVPKANTDVLVAFIDNSKTNGAVILCKETDAIKIMGDADGGLVRISDLKDNLNAIKQYLSALNTAIGVGFTAVGAGTSANGASGKSAFDGAMASQQINYSDMENKKVKHGEG